MEHSCLVILYRKEPALNVLIQIFHLFQIT